MLESDGWQVARLIPTSGINGQDEAERRATSALLAVLQAVREFRLALLKPFGAPSGQLESFIEVPFTLADDRTVYPDGLLNVTRGKTSWTALVEVKTGSAELKRDQVESYLDAARDGGFDCVLTISNQLAPAPGVHPVQVDRRKLRRVALHHLSWAEVVTAAVQTRVHRGVEDADQAWILGELIRYLEHPRSGALDFDDMGPNWVATRDAVIAGTIRASDKGIAEVASRWDQLLRFGALRLGRELGADVQVVVSRKELADPAARLARFVNELVTSATLSGVFRVPDAISDVEVCCDLRAGTVSVSVELAAPHEGRLPTRVNWLVRQLSEAPGQLRIDGLIAGTRASTSELLSTLREDPALLVDSQRREFRSFRVTATSQLGTKRGTGRGAFIDSVLAAVDGFYEGIVQNLRPWTAKAPKLPRSGRTAAEEAGLDLAPPVGDLVDEVDSDQVESPEADLPEALDDAIEEGHADDPTPPPADNRIDDLSPTMIEWAPATERLERERDHFALS
jgi:hypothetical protein